MMVICIHAYAGAKEIVRRHWRHYGHRWGSVVGVTPEGDESFWPSPIPTLAAGTDEYWMLSRCNLPRKIVSTFAWLAERWPHAESVLIAEYDSLILQKPPDYPGGFVCNVYGPCPPQWQVKAKWFLHTPWWTDIPTCRKLAEAGEELLRNQECENGSPDVFLGYLCDYAGVECRNPPGIAFSCNGFKDGGPLEEARQAVEKGAWFVHGVKTHSEFDTMLGSRPPTWRKG